MKYKIAVVENKVTQISGQMSQGAALRMYLVLKQQGYDVIVIRCSND